MKNFLNHPRIFLLSMLFFAGLAIFPCAAHSWTSARIESATVSMDLSKEAVAEVATKVRFTIEGGKFHGFDLARLKGAELIQDRCVAALDDGREIPLSFRPVSKDQTRIALAKGLDASHGAVTFSLIHEIGLIQSGALRLHQGRARLDWTPIVWDQGLDAMSIEIRLPGRSHDAPIGVDPAVSQDYEVEVKDTQVTLTKFRPVRWYPMQVVVDFDPSLVPALGSLRPEPEEKRNESKAAAVVSPPRPATPLHIAVLPAAVALVGLILLMRKAAHLDRAFARIGLTCRYRLLPNTGKPLRFALSAAAAAIGLWAQYRGAIAAGVPSFAVVAALWIVHREKGELKPRTGGSWRAMAEDEAKALRKLAAKYRRGRRSLMDVTLPEGAFAFTATLFALGYFAAVARESWPSTAWSLVLDGLVLLIPVWFSNVRAELPVDTCLEGFWTLKRWRKAVSRAVGAVGSGLSEELWLREDENGPVEVRLRVFNPMAGVKGIELAGEVFCAGSMHKTRMAAVLRMEPGTEAARRIAACKYSVEHHLTPDLEEEIVVLRNRRGSVGSDIAPLRVALARLAA